MGGKSSHPITGKYDASRRDLQASQQRTIKKGNISPTCPRSRKSRTTVVTLIDDADTWIHKDMHVEEVYELHEVIAYGHFGPIQVCSRKRLRRRTHTGDLVILDGGSSPSSLPSIKESERTNMTNTSSDSSSTLAAQSSPQVIPISMSQHKLFACKSIATSRCRQEAEIVEKILEELTKIREWNHPNILNVNRVFVSKRNLWIVTDLCTGGDLWSHVDTNVELDVVDVLEQVLNGLAYLHKNQTTLHGDVCMENILYEHVSSNGGIKLIDFALFRKFGRGKLCWKVCGADYAAAPEAVVNDGKVGNYYTRHSDMWSVGVVAYCLLSGGSLPFGTDYELDMKRLETASFEFGDEFDVRQVSERGKTFCTNCLQRLPEKRWNAGQALEFVHEWMSNLEASELLRVPKDSPPVPPPSSMKKISSTGSLRGLQEFGLYGDLKNRVLTTMAATMPKSKIVELKRDLMTNHDQDGTGLITLKQVRNAMKRMHKEQGDACGLTKEDLKEMFKGGCFYQENWGMVEMERFLDGVLELKGMMAHEQLQKAFDRVDSQGNDHVTIDEAERLLRPHCTDDYVDDMMQASGCDNGGSVYYDTLLQFMFHDPAKAMDHVYDVVDSPGRISRRHSS